MPPPSPPRSAPLPGPPRRSAPPAPVSGSAGRCGTSPADGAARWRTSPPGEEEKRPLSEVSYRRDSGGELPACRPPSCGVVLGGRGVAPCYVCGGSGGAGGVCVCWGTHARRHTEGPGAPRVPAERRVCARPPALHVRIPAHVAQIKFKLEVNTSGGGCVCVCAEEEEWGGRRRGEREGGRLAPSWLPTAPHPPNPHAPGC